MTVYSAPWSRLLIGLSWGASAILVGVAFLTWRNVREPEGLGLALAALSILVIALAALFSIRAYRVDGPHLYVRRLLWETDVDLRELESVAIDPAAMQGSIRLFGNGGLFSFSGIFRSKRLGRYRAFVTDHHRAVVLRLSGRTVVVSPGEPQALVADILGRSPRVRDDTPSRFEEGR
ncbi:MAG: hypothetical protein GY769_22380 [bacterium]|nr:hypothetical protein [bacterium]